MRCGLGVLRAALLQLRLQLCPGHAAGVGVLGQGAFRLRRRGGSGLLLCTVHRAGCCAVVFIARAWICLGLVIMELVVTR